MKDPQHNNDAGHGDDPRHGPRSATMGVDPTMTATEYYHRPNGMITHKPGRSFWHILDEAKWLLAVLVAAGFIGVPATTWQLGNLRTDLEARMSLSDERTAGKLAVMSQSQQATREDVADLKADIKELLRRIPEVKAGAPGSPAPAPYQATRWRSKTAPKKTGLFGF